MGRVKYDNEWKKRLHQALEENDGNQTAAAKVMGVTQQTVRQIIAADPSMSGRWLAGKLSKQTMHRNAQPLSDSDALKRENQLMAKGLDAMGITGQSKAEALAFLEFGQSSLGSVRQLIGGGVVKLFSDLMGDISHIRQELASGVEEEREKVLREDKSSLIKHVLEAYDRANKAALTDAIVKQKMEERKGSGSRGKPGFTAIQINEPKEVKLSTEGDTDTKSKVQD